jgi:O-antigen ligase
VIGVSGERDSLLNRSGAVGLKQIHLTVLKAWDRAQEWNLFQWIDASGMLGLYLFSFGVLYRTLLVYEGLLLMGIAFALRIKTLEKRVLKDPLLILSAAFLVFLLIRTYFAGAEFKEHQSLVWEGMLKLFLFGFLVVFVVGYWMSRYPYQWNHLVIALIVGHMVRVVRKFDFGYFYNEFGKIWTGVYRIGWGSTVNRFGLWSAVIFFSCMILRRNIWGARRKTNELMYWLRVMLWTLAVILSGVGLIYSQSRSAWLAAVLVTPVIFFYSFYPAKKIPIKPAALIGVLVLVISVMTNLHTVVEKRLQLEGPIVDYGSVKISIDARFSLYQLFWEKWTERPLWGYGPGTSEIIIRQAEDKYAAIKIWDHFHNFAFDFTFQLGIAGMLFFMASFYLIFRQFFSAYRNERIDRNYFLFAIVGLTLMFICGLVGHPFGDFKGVFLFGFFGGLCYQSKFLGQSGASRSGSLP